MARLDGLTAALATPVEHEDDGLGGNASGRDVDVEVRLFTLAFDNGRKSKAVEEAKDQKIQQLEAKLTVKNEVISELMEENVKAKKEFGEL